MRNYDHALQKAKKIAQTPEGKELIVMLQNMGNTEWNEAVQSAAGGDYSRLQQALQKLMEDPEARKLLEKLG